MRPTMSIRKAVRFSAAYVLVILSVATLILVAFAYWVGDHQLSADADRTIFMVVLMVGFVACMLLLVWLGVRIRKEAIHADEEWPPRITK
jgi:uncharacterized membrane protein YidH (DUF202 family)